MMKFKLEIKPAIPVKDRHKIEGLLKRMGYRVSGGGTDADESACDISFSVYAVVDSSTGATMPPTMAPGTNL